VNVFQTKEFIQNLLEVFQVRAKLKNAKMVLVINIRNRSWKAYLPRCNCRKSTGHHETISCQWRIL